MTKVVIAICFSVWGAITLAGPERVNAHPSYFGFANSVEVWTGASWTIVTSSFVHIDFWHLFLNMLALCSLGQVV